MGIRSLRDEVREIFEQPPESPEYWAVDELLERSLGIHQTQCPADLPVHGDIGTETDGDNGYLPSQLAAIQFASKYIEPGDRVYDLGAGLGKVLLSLGLLHPDVTFVGVEKDPGIAAFLSRKIQELGLPNARCVRSCADTAYFQNGTFFYLFQPFYGERQERVSRRIAEIPDARVCYKTTWSSSVPNGFSDFYLEEAQALPEREGQVFEHVMLLRNI